ncbi:MAG: caspase family protein, partial [Actinomycetota bacterium]
NYEFGWINFADRDAAAVSRLLVEKMGFPPENVVLLQNSEASRNNIIYALDWLVDNPYVDESSEVVVYYSGHGVRSGPGVGMNIPELPSAYALAPFDFMNFDFKKGAGLIWDSELAAKLSQINPAKMWVSIDSCSSGGFLRPGITGPNRIVTASRRGDEISSEIDLVQRGVFTQLVVEEGLARGLTVEEAFAAAVPRASQEFGQNPQIADEYPGSMAFR